MGNPTLGPQLGNRLAASCCLTKIILQNPTQTSVAPLLCSRETAASSRKRVGTVQPKAFCVVWNDLWFICFQYVTAGLAVLHRSHWGRALPPQEHQLNYFSHQQLPTTLPVALHAAAPQRSHKGPPREPETWFCYKSTYPYKSRFKCAMTKTGVLWGSVLICNFCVFDIHPLLDDGWQLLDHSFEWTYLHDQHKVLTTSYHRTLVASSTLNY